MSFGPLAGGGANVSSSFDVYDATECIVPAWSFLSRELRTMGAWLCWKRSVERSFPGVRSEFGLRSDGENSLSWEWPMRRRAQVTRTARLATMTAVDALKRD